MPRRKGQNARGMIVALIAVVSVAALGQFSLFYWRATLAVTAAKPVSEALRNSAGIDRPAVEAADFASLVHLVEVCPALRNDKGGIGSVRFYFRVLSSIRKLLGPARSEWATAEMNLCSRYLAVRLDQRITNNRGIWQATA